MDELNKYNNFNLDFSQYFESEINSCKNEEYLNNNHNEFLHKIVLDYNKNSNVNNSNTNNQSIEKHQNLNKNIATNRFESVKLNYSIQSNVLNLDEKVKSMREIHKDRCELSNSSFIQNQIKTACKANNIKKNNYESNFNYNYLSNKLFSYNKNNNNLNKNAHINKNVDTDNYNTNNILTSASDVKTAKDVNISKSKQINNTNNNNYNNFKDIKYKISDIESKINKVSLNSNSNSNTQSTNNSSYKDLSNNSTKSKNICLSLCYSTKNK